jgi:hypothetical protein
MRKLWIPIVLGAIACISSISAFEIPGTHTVVFEDMTATEGHKLEQAEAAAALATYNAALDAVDKTWGVIKNIFSSSSKTTLVEKSTGLKFSELNTKSIVKKYQGVQPENLYRIRDVTGRSAKIPAENKQDYIDFFDTLEITDSQTFQLNNNAYKTKDILENSQTKYLTFMGMKDEATNKYTVITVDIEANFKIAEDLYIWETQTSKFGGLFQKTEQRLEKRPHDLTLEEAETLMQWFDSVTLKHLKTQLQQIIDTLSGKPTQFLQ